MAVKFHINMEKGIVGECTASIRECPVSGAHFTTESQAESVKDEMLSMEFDPMRATSKNEVANANISSSYELQTAVSQTEDTAAMVAHDDAQKNWETAVADKSQLMHLPGRLKVPGARGLPANMTIDEFDEQNTVSPPLCGECNTQLGPPSMTISLTSGQRIFCEHCESMNVLYEGSSFEHVDTYLYVDLNESSDTYAATVKENVKDMIWYHVTDREDWARDIQDPKTGAERVHAGGVMASLDRMYQKYYYDRSGEPPKLYMYQIELDDDVKVTEDILDDNNDDLEFLDAIDEHKEEFGEDAHVVRYVNKWEDPGSISLSIDSKKMKVRSVRTVLKDDFNSPAKMFFDAAIANQPEIDRLERVSGYVDDGYHDDF